ncbi:glycoside hydrolase [Chytriomyces cf. hyalinus JEL632]|nr:glycoside hydrolase [Chytriomyces cf. hyalinus JEL632]
MHLVLSLAVLAASATATASSASSNASLTWGSYRPNVYFGTRSRTPETVLTGLMWHDVHEYIHYQKMRHSCEQGDELDSYAWLQHDGRSFGSQSIKDKDANVHIKTELLKSPGGDHGGDWVVRVSGTPMNESESSAIAVYFYMALAGDGNLEIVNTNGKSRGLDSVQLNGNVNGLGDFSFYMHDDENNEVPYFAEKESRRSLGDVRKTQYTAYNAKPEDTWKVKDMVLEQLLRDAQSCISKHSQNPPNPAHGFLLQSNDVTEGNVFVFQKMLKAPFQFDVAFVSKSAHPESDSLSVEAQPLLGDALTKKLETASQVFHDRFERTFHLKDKGYDERQVEFGEMMLSNMLGGVGYFHGTNIVDRSLEDWEESEPVDFLSQDSGREEGDDYFSGDDDDSDPSAPKKPQPAPKREGPSSLFSAVPSRPFFPRGFLWDEGFHELLIGAWDNDLSLEIISSWSSKIDANGWVAREQILGAESESKVPAEFQIQYAHFANPPTLLMSLLKFMERLNQAQNQVPVAASASQPDYKSSLDNEALSRLHLDDPKLAKEYLMRVYPQFKRQYFWFRRTQWGDVDNYGREGKSSEAYRWRGRSGYHTLTSGLDDYPRAMPPQGSEIHVDLISWVGSMAKALKAVATELGIEKDVKKYDKHISNIQQALDDYHWNEESQAYCDAVEVNGESTHVVHLGYLNLFPFILNIVPEDSPRIESFLDLISDPETLWTDFGLASLSKGDKFFATGENYWRGPIWMNIQYLVLKQLYHYKSLDKPYSKRAGDIYTKLRDNIVQNVFEQYERTGYTWEQYSPIDGKGQRSHPFTGWTALVLLMMAEIY